MGERERKKERKERERKKENEKEDEEKNDDDTDEDIFSLPDERIFSVRIGKKKLSHAKYFLERQSEITLLLKKIVQLNAEKNK